jgi:murein DD-endopeptidase MepM/ murein hydrolase activator NlpD
MRSPDLQAPSRLLAPLLCLLALWLSPGRASAQANAVTLTPDMVVAGSPELIHVQATADAKLDADWLGRKVQFFPTHNGRDWFALAAVDVEAPTGPSVLRVVARSDKGTLEFSRTIEIHPAHYRTGSLTVSPKFVEPDPEALQLIQSEIKLKAKVFSESASEPLWAGNFRAPVTAQPTDSFGTRRTFNGKLASIHKGMDFRAPTGTLVHAGNRGKVVLARPLYYEGNCVVIDHGLGIFTISMHLSRIDVKEGQHVATGERLGLSGATGRVTGPHLHWAVRWQDAYLDPAKLLRLNLDSVISAER